jgi:hypothetical protein
MISRKGIVIAAVSFLFANTASAAVYKTVDEHGNVVYTDDPAGHGEPIKLPPLSTVPPPKYLQAPANSADEGAGTASSGYRQLTITAPTQDETLRDNTGNVPVTAKVTPELNAPAGDRLQYFLDGQPYGQPTDSQKLLMPNLDRGEHTVSVAVVSPSGKELSHSDDVRFYLHRQSINFPRGPGQPAPHVNP